MFGGDVVAVLPAGQAYDPPEQDLLYDLVASTTLPIIDISKSVRSVLFSRRRVERLNRTIARTRMLLFIISNMGILSTVFSLLGPAQIGRWLAIPTVVVAIPAPIIQILMMRYEIVLLLLTTYDFWFFSLMWAGSMTTYSACLADSRVLLVFIAWLSVQGNIMIDANVSYRESIYFTVMGLIFSIVMILAIMFNTVDDVGNFRVLSVNGYELTAHDVIVNGWSTCLLVLVRNLYRRRAALKDHGANKTVVQCLSFRCRVRLRGRTRRRRSGSSLSSAGSVTSVSSALMTKPTASYFQNAKMVQMRCMRSKVKFIPRNLVAAFARRLFEYRDNEWHVVSLRYFFMLLMGVGIVSTGFAFSLAMPRFCCVVSLATASLFSVFSVTVYHRQLLKYLVFSFDFAFLSVQLTIMCLALCDLYRWDSRALSLAACWLWVHWVLTFDCMPPVIKNKLRLRNRFVLFIAVHFVLAHVALVYQLTSSKRETFNDRAIFSAEVSNFDVRVTVLPLLVSRMLMTFGWSCRLVWRLWNRNDNELIVIQGTVTYINNRRKIKVMENKLQAERTKSVVQQFARQVTRRLSALGTAIVPEVSTLSAAEPPSTTEGPVVRFIGPPMNTRLTNIASQILDATRKLPQLQQQMSLTGLPHPGLSMFDASGPMLFEAVSPPRRGSAVQPEVPHMKITPLDSSSRVIDSPSPETRSDVIQAVKEDSECESTEESQQPRFQI